MKNYLLIATLILAISCKQRGLNESPVSEGTKNNYQLDSTYLFKAKPHKGFNFDYYLFLPKGLNVHKVNTILIESTNSGLSDDIEHHMTGAKLAASRSSVGNHVSNKLKIPLLVPIFPRSETNWKLYTHALDSETFNEMDTELERIDLQLLAMFEDAKNTLSSNGYRITEKFFMTGFSASGTFANRFSILHPEKIKAVCAGGVNSILTLPLEESIGKKLNFPIGIADVEAVTGAKANLDEFKNLPQFWFMGENDENDAAKYDDAYNQNERELIFDILGVTLIPDRWESVQKIYEAHNIPAIFKVYEGIGHGTDLRINNEISDFFAKQMN